MPANASQNENPLATWALDREIVLSRVINAPRELVFSAWVDPPHLPQWFGPAGFRVETKSMDIRVNGEWRFDMVAPDGKRYTNRMQFRCIERPHLIEFDHDPRQRIQHIFVESRRSKEGRQQHKD